MEIASGRVPGRERWSLECLVTVPLQYLLHEAYVPLAAGKLPEEDTERLTFRQRGQIE